MNAKVDEYISNTKKWQAEITLLRTLLLDCGLTEEFKWRTPTGDRLQRVPILI